MFPAGFRRRADNAPDQPAGNHSTGEEVTMTFICISAILFTVAAALCWALAPLCARAARALGLVDNPGERKIHGVPVPYGGGIAILGSVCLTVGAAYAAIAGGGDWLPATWRAFLATHWDGLTDAATLRKLGCLLGGAGTVFLLGLVDDFHPLRPKLKIAVQIAAAALAWYGGVRVPELGGGAVTSFILTLSWIIVITNAFNLLDNMDGLSAGTAFIACLALFGIMCARNYFTAAMLIVFAGALAGFLPRNFARAEHKIFMGDAGALLTGYFLATLAFAGTYYEGKGLTHALLMPLILLGVPLFDTASVIIIRLKNHKPVMVGDTNHLSHRLVRQGFTRHQAVGVICILSVILGLLAQLLVQLDAPGAVITFAAVFFTITLMALLMLNPRGRQ